MQDMGDQTTLDDTSNVSKEKQEESSNVLKDAFTTWKNFHNFEEKQNVRNDINDNFILKTELEVNERNIKTALHRGDFFLARRIWNKSKHQYHDHFVFVKERFVR